MSSLYVDDPKETDLSIRAQVDVSFRSLDSDDESETYPVPNERFDFAANLSYWKSQTQLSSVNNFTNSYFKTIVKMGEAAVPFILEEIQKEPSQLVHALDLIYPNKVRYKGFVSLKQACDTWIKILRN